MYIHEATKQALLQNRDMLRLSNPKFIFTPTNTEELITVYSSVVGSPSPRWAPSAQDLMADDWLVVGSKKHDDT